MARLMSGELSVSSTEGVGSVFTLSLPLMEATPAIEPAALQPSPIALSGLRVLVAEDNAVNQLVIRRLLERHGVTVDIVPNGEEAVSAWSRLSPDVILMDCQMPVCDGYEATRRLRALGAEQPIIALTANSMPGDRARCLEAGMDEHLGKPVQVESLVGLLQQLHTGDRSERVVAGRAVGDD
ncbi:MAG: CheY-like chemotaxis protein [Myxococcota bacterium]